MIRYRQLSVTDRRPLKTDGCCRQLATVDNCLLLGGASFIAFAKRMGILYEKCFPSLRLSVLERYPLDISFTWILPGNNNWPAKTSSETFLDFAILRGLDSHFDLIDLRVEMKITVFINTCIFRLLVLYESENHLVSACDLHSTLGKLRRIDIQIRIFILPYRK